MYKNYNINTKYAIIKLMKYEEKESLFYQKCLNILIEMNKQDIKNNLENIIKK